MSSLISDLQVLLSKYWDLAYAEGRERRDHDTSDGQAQATLEAIEELVTDKIDGLEADLESAVRVAYDRGAIEWTRLNYPSLYQKWSSK